MWLPALIVGLTGCAPNRIRGEIDGLPIPIASAFLVLEAGALGDDDLLVVSLSSLPSACRVFDHWESRAAGAGTAEELAAAWAEAFPDDWWQVDLVLRQASGSWPPEGAVWPGLAHDAFPEEAGDVFANFVHHRLRRDADWFSGAAPDEDYEAAWLSDLGALRIDRGEPGTRLAGRFATRAVDADGVAAGEVEVIFDATPCPRVGTGG